MVKIPAGVFLMGAYAAKGNSEEKPAHEAIVASFYLDRTEVTVEAYQQCVAAGKCQPAKTNFRFCNTKFEDRSNHPINCITLYDAADYCAFRGKRVPTEREWEYAARGGQERRRFSWGSEDPDKKNSCYDHPFGSCPVGSFAPGAFGLHDMSGNVWEWTASAFKPYPTSWEADEISQAHFFVYRGGSWSRRFPKWLRTALRNRYKPDQLSAALGVRCAKICEPLECPAETTEREGKCVRSSGEVLCEPHYKWIDGECRLDAGAPAGPLASGQPGSGQAVALGPEHGSDKRSVAGGFSRSRTPQHDADCQRHWPKTPASYLFTGGDSYHSRKATVRAAGCVPRDMGRTWTSACCQG